MSRRKGLTPVELCIVVGIIFVMAAILFPVLGVAGRKVHKDTRKWEMISTTEEKLTKAKLSPDEPLTLISENGDEVLVWRRTPDANLSPRESAQMYREKFQQAIPGVQIVSALSAGQPRGDGSVRPLIEIRFRLPEQSPTPPGKEDRS